MASPTGRPRLPAEERRDHYLRIRVSDLELELIRAAARHAKKRPTTWARRLLVAAASEIIGE